MASVQVYPLTSFIIYGKDPIFNFVSIQIKTKDNRSFLIIPLTHLPLALHHGESTWSLPEEINKVNIFFKNNHNEIS